MRSNSKLQVLRDAENKLHALRNTTPTGIRSIDDATDAKIEALTVFVSDLKAKLTPKPIACGHDFDNGICLGCGLDRRGEMLADAIDRARERAKYGD